MSFQERRSIVNLVSTILVIAFYSAFMLQRLPDGNAYSPEVFRFWGTFFLILVPVMIISRIVIHIVFYVVNTIATKEEESSVTDERDHLIELKAIRFSLYVFAFGFLLAMGSLLIDLSPSAMFSILLCSAFLSEIVSEISRFYFYRSGV
jgi:hypothetical protein